MDMSDFRAKVSPLFKDADMTGYFIEDGVGFAYRQYPTVKQAGYVTWSSVTWFVSFGRGIYGSGETLENAVASEKEQYDYAYQKQLDARQLDM